jgi:hypothetical protein
MHPRLGGLVIAHATIYDPDPADLLVGSLSVLLAFNNSLCVAALKVCGVFCFHEVRPEGACLWLKQSSRVNRTA